MKKLVFALITVLSATAMAEQKFECFGQGKVLTATDYYIVRLDLSSATEGRLFALSNCPNCNSVGGIKQVMARGAVKARKNPKARNSISYFGGDDYPYWIEIPRGVVGRPSQDKFRARFVYDMNDGPGEIPYDVVCHQL